MTDYAAQVDELVASAEGLGHGPARIAVLEEAARVADAHDDERLGFQVRERHLISAGTFGGAPDVTLVAFAWCLARLDADPARYAHAGGMNRYGLLWMYKWVVDAAVEYPTIGRGQIEEMLADLERRYVAVGSGPHPVHQTARGVYRDMCDWTAAKAAHAKVLRSKPDVLSNCPACEQSAQVKFYLATNRPALARKKAEPILDGRMACATVPHTVYGSLLLPTLFAGEPEAAAAYHRAGDRLIGTNPDFLHTASYHLVFLAVTDNLPGAAKYLGRHLANGLVTTSPASRFEFAATAAFALDRLAERPRPPKVRVPAGAVLSAGLDATNPAAMRDHFLGEARELAAAFDARNGNDGFARRLAELDELKERITPYKV